MNNMQKKPSILVINDDGINAPGLKHLWRPLADHFDLYIVAPAFEQSGKGLAITLRKPLLIETHVWEKGVTAWKVTGTPADCVKLAVNSVLKSHPSLIVSGINRGANSGRNVLYSGTVGGVIEGVMRGIPGIAFSCADYDKPLYHVAEKYILPIVQHVLEHPLPSHTILNVNFPDTGETIKGFKMARQGAGYWTDNPDERTHPEGHSYYWLGGRWTGHEEHEDSDVHLLKQGYATAVPIHVGDLTHSQHLVERKSLFENLFERIST